MDHIPHGVLVRAHQAGDRRVIIVEQATDRTTPYWRCQFAKAVPLPTTRQINKILGKDFVTQARHHRDRMTGAIRHRRRRRRRLHRDLLMHLAEQFTKEVRS